MKKGFVLCCAGLIIGMGLTAAEDQIQKTFDVGKGGTLFIDSDIGSIHITPQASDRVDIIVTFETKTGSSRKLKSFMEEIDLSFEKDNKDVHITLEDERDFYNKNWKNRVTVKFEIKVPEKYNTDVKTSGGSISVGDLDGSVLARTSGGSLRFGKITGSVNGKTSGGGIHLKGCAGEVKVNTSGGSIEIGEVKGTVDAHTSGGSISVTEVMGTINAHTSGGSITAKITRQPENECQLKTSGGSINVYLNSDIGLHLDARTSGGRVRTDFPVMVQGNISGHSLDADINGGGPLLLLRTSGGSISVNHL